MSKTLDENDRHIAGTLPRDPGADAAPMTAPQAKTRKATLHLVCRDTDALRLPAPSDVHAEAALLACLLWCGAHAPAVLDVTAVRDILDDPEIFSTEAHARIFSAMVAVAEANAHHDAVAVHSELLRRGHARDAGGIEYLDQLVTTAATLSSVQARAYAQSVRDAWVRRTLIAALQISEAEARRGQGAADAIVAAAHARIGEVHTVATATEARTPRLAQGLNEVLRELTTPDAVDDRIRTGFATFDEMTGGLLYGDVSLLAACTSVGKSMLAGQWALSVTRTSLMHAVLYVSLEMRVKSFARRLLSANAQVQARKIRRKSVDPSEFDRILAAGSALALPHLYFADSPAQTILDIHATATRLRAKLAPQGVRLALIVVDHVHLVKPSGEVRKKGNRESEVAETSRGLMYLAERHACHVLGLVQINRDAEKRGLSNDAPPRLHEIAESANLARNANNVFILHRTRNKQGMFIRDVPACLVVAKQRDDEAGIIELDVDPRFVQFSDRPQ